MMAFHHNVKRVKEVSEVRRVYVDGRSAAAIEMRRRLAEIDNRYGQDACFSLSNRPLSDAVLSVSQSSSMTGFDALLGQSGTSVSGELDIKGSDPRYYTAHGEPGLTNDGSGAGAQKVLRELYQEAGCTKNGERQ